MKKFCFALVLLAATAHAQARTEYGKLGGAEFRIDVPEHWNRTLIVFYHGYRAEAGGVGYGAKKPIDAFVPAFTRSGNAVIQSGYSKGGWAVEQAIPETEALRRYFVHKYGKPRETYVAGVSMGGLLAVITIEQSPGIYSGALDLCGAVSDTASLFTRGFDLRVEFDYFFPGVLPNPAKVSTDYEASSPLKKQVAEALASKPEAADALRLFAGVRDNKDLTEGLLFGTWALKDIERRAGGNPFDNRNTIYSGGPDDNALNDGVERYAADPGAFAYLHHYYTPTGRLSRPVLAMHTTYDPVVPPSLPGKYATLTRAVGAADFFVAQYIKRDGHCNFKVDEVERGFAELRDWKDKGIKPVPGSLK